MVQILLPVIVNRSGGTASTLGDNLADQIHEAFAASDQPIDLQLVAASDLEVALAKVAGAPVVAVGGGDGTLGSAAGKFAEAGSALAILPFGTRNHLAKQLGIPAELSDAVKVIAAGRRQRIDIARAGQRVFVNNASVGLYTRLVRARDAISGPKWLGTIPATWNVLRRLHARPFKLSLDGSDRTLNTPLLFIGNNTYSLEGGMVGERKSMTDGILSFYAVSARTPLQLIAMAARTLLGRADLQRDFCAITEAQNARIDGVGGLDIALDGEVERMQLPLDFAILPNALEVIVP
jgi:diacylglycerol kinase family enzyme